MNRFFHETIEPCLKCIPMLDVMHSEVHNGREFRFKQKVRRNVYPEFDQKLSCYLAATGDGGFPAYTVEIEIIEAQSNGRVNHLASAFHDSVPHALKDLAERAVARAGPVELTFQRSVSKGAETSSVRHLRKIRDGDIKMLAAALDICRALGDVEFLDIAGDFGTIVATPPGNLNPVVIHLQDNTVSVPSSPISDAPPFKWPISSFAELASTNPAAQSYLARVGQALVTEKEEAILAFRAGAEQRIVNFHRALAGRQLGGHWLEPAKGLVARLKAGLGETFAGISAHARGIALDLSDAILDSGCTHAANVPGDRGNAGGSGITKFLKLK